METSPAPQRLPSGTVTFMFTDIQDSTQRWDRDRTGMQEAMRRHDVIMRSAIEATAGFVFKTIGDAFCAVFARPEDAMACALEVQRRLSAEDFSAVDGLRVRIALHAGTADERDGDYFGPAVNRVARILSAGHGGQVLLSGVAAEMVREHQSENVTLRDLGRHRLKGLAQAELVYQLVAPGLETQFPALRSLDAHPNNLPPSLTTFIGREAELAEARKLLEQTRLLTLAGAGGVGKTRLAVQLASDLLDEFEDGVWFVDFAPLSEGLFVSSTMLSALGVREEPGRDTLETLVDHLREKTALIVLDNCEHIVTEVAKTAARLLRDCKRLHLLATSREVIGVQGEVVYRIPTFDESAGIALFESRARSAVQTFSITSENVETVKRICKRLDGIPLAIELAAARVKMMNVEDLWKRLDDRFRILTGGSRTALPRQQTLRGLIDWSYNLLDDVEKALVRRLSIFASDFSLDAATAICAKDPIEDFEVLDLLARLIDKSLVQFHVGEERYSLLESTKELCFAHLVEAGESDALQRRRAEHYESKAQAAWAQARTPNFQDVCAEIERDYAEHRATLQWALSDGNDAPLGARTAVALSAYWMQRGYSQEGRLWLERVLERGQDEVGTGVWAEVLMCIGNQYFAEGEYELMESAVRRAEEAYIELNDLKGQGWARLGLGIAALLSGRFDSARDLLEAAMTISREIENPHLEVAALQNLAQLLTDWKCDYAASEVVYAEALEIARDLNNEYYVGAFLGDWSQAAAYGGALDRARELVQRALDIFRRLGNEHRTEEQLVRLGHYRVWAGDVAGSNEALCEAIELLRKAMHPHYVAQCSEACADFALALEKPEDAAMLLGFSEEWRAGKKLTRPAPMQERCGASADVARASLGDEAFETAWETGRALAPAAALHLAETLLRPAAAATDSAH